MHRQHVPVHLHVHQCWRSVLTCVCAGLWFAVRVCQPVVHSSVTRSLFPTVAKHIFTHLLSAVHYVLLYGRRSIQEEQTRGQNTRGARGMQLLSCGRA